MTDSTPDAESPAPRRRGLWAMMGQAVPPEETVADEAAVAATPVAPVEDSAVENSTATDETDREATPNVAPSGRRGLWSLMRQSVSGSTPEPVADEAINATAATDLPTTDLTTEEASVPPVAPRGLFSLMQRAAEETETEVGRQETGGRSQETAKDDDRERDERIVSSTPHSALRTPHSSEADVDEHEFDEEEDSDDERTAVALPPLPINPDDLEPPRYRRAAAQAAKQSWMSLGCGVAAVGASALAMLPQVWIGFPATGLGFAAIIAGYLTLTGSARREMAALTRAVSVMGMLLGTTGIFLGPLFFSELGRSLREATGQQLTSKHLAQLGVALNRYHDQQQAFPVGGVFARDAAGVVKGQHGWMTFLLPFVGEQQIYQSIVQDKPYDDPANRAAMSRDVAAYFAAGGDRAKIGQGFAVAHFAGVGGEIDDATGLSQLGIFQRDEAVKKEDVTDGLANTLVVGELAGTYPPWGDPENWRAIGRGLNKDVNGFGSATGQGAAFLMGDGSVRVFNNKTDPRLLRKLSTRDGGEP